MTRLFSVSICCGAVLVLLSFGLAGRLHAAEEASVKLASGLTFEKDIVPIFKAHCIKCHGGELKKAGLDLRRRFAILAGGDSGAAIAPGKADESLLIELIESGEMPPEDEKPLPEKELEILRHWIAGGAATQSKEEAPLEDEGDTRVTEEDRQFWAFKPPQRPPIPQVKTVEQVRTPIDAFLLAKLEEKGGSFNSDAERNVLIRRLYFDLLGLAPTPEEVDRFTADDREDAYERLVDQLLSSPRYGERWGRRWLDVAGYADSDGYLAADRIRPEAWRYRDYVIRAHNSDKPYDRFTLEQLAGDELADWRGAKEMTPELADNLIATGYLRTALDPTYGGYKEPLECYKVMADTMQIIGSTYLGLTLQCARCHGHKLDPISQHDYYKLHSILLSSYDPKEWQVSIARNIPLATDAEQASIKKNNATVTARLKIVQSKIADLTNRYHEKYLADKITGADDTLRTQIKAALLVEKKKRNEAQKKLIQQYAVGLSLANDVISKNYPAFGSELAKLQSTLKTENSLLQTIVQLRGLKDLDDQPRQTHILIRGDYDKPGKAVEPGLPSVLVPAGFKMKIEPGNQTTGRRKALARWLVDPQNPLTARVHVNRMWSQHFGRGIVSTLENFGKTGDPPTHPELLDFLAREFIDGGWSQKKLHRLLVTSTAYRQSSQPNEKMVSLDPENKLLGSWPPMRHEGEVIRDVVLQMAGKLNRQMYGQPIAVSRLGDGQVVVADNPASNRASIYLIVRRSQPVTIMELFDTPRMEVNCAQRNESIVVTQALTMLNSKFVETNAKVFSERLRHEAGDSEEARLDLAYRLLFARSPTTAELGSILEFLDSAARAQLGEKFETATLPEKHSARQVGWSQLALVLLNSNEFLFVH